jgi:hypothetical protein
LPSVAQIIEKSLVLVGERQQKQQLEQVG